MVFRAVAEQLSFRKAAEELYLTQPAVSLQIKALEEDLAGGRLGRMGNPRMASIMKDTLSYHTTPVEAAEIAKAAGVKALVYYHLTQAGLPMFTPEAFTKGVDAVGFTDWRLSKDGMTIELPVGSSDIVWSQQ